MSTRRELEQLFSGAPTPPSPQQLSILYDYLQLLLRWSKRINLTGFRTIQSAAEGLLYDAAELAYIVPEGLAFTDVGSGAGGMAICLAVLRPDLKLLLVEPRLKRAVFLRTAIRELRLGERAEVRQARAEELPRELARETDAVMAQAVLPPSRWLPLAMTLVRDGGTIYCLTAKRLTEEEVPQELLRLEERAYSLPVTGAPRVITALRAGER